MGSRRHPGSEQIFVTERSSVVKDNAHPPIHRYGSSSPCLTSSYHHAPMIRFPWVVRVIMSLSDARQDKSTCLHTLHQAYVSETRPACSPSAARRAPGIFAGSPGIFAAKSQARGIQSGYDLSHGTSVPSR